MVLYVFLKGREEMEKTDKLQSNKQMHVISTWTQLQFLVEIWPFLTFSKNKPT